MSNYLDLFQISDTNILQRLLMTDELTSLYNRRYFRQYLDELKRQETEKKLQFTLLFLDIDNFKEFNDNYGHSCGDNVLIEVAKILKNAIENRGKIFRYAGDEFTIILPRHDENEAIAMSQRILEHLKNFFPYSQFPARMNQVTISIGYACYPDEGKVFSQIIDAADRALYYAKKQGRGVFFGGCKMKVNLEKLINNWPPIVYCKELVGRNKEIGYLREKVVNSEDGKGQIVLIEGEAGIGKSRLIRQFARSLRAGDYNIIIGDCSNSTTMIPYHPFREGLSHCFEAKDPRMLRCFKELDEPFRRELIKFIPSFVRFVDEKGAPPGESSIDRFLLYQSILNLLVSFSKNLPVIFILDDIHWADEASLNLIVYLARQTENEKIMICTCFREEEAPNSNFYHMIQSMSRESRVKHIKLGRLNEDSISRMIDVIFESHVLPDEFKLWVHQETEGNPFYAEEIIKSLLEEHKIVRTETGVAVGDYMKFGLPHSIKELILRRVLRLNANEQRILGYASVIGHEFTSDLVAKLLEEDESYVLDILDKARKAFIIKEMIEDQEEKYSFYHNKIRETIYLEMGFIKRKKLHLRLAELIEKLYPDNLHDFIEILSFHYSKAQAYEKAYHYSLRAADKAIAIQSFQQGIIYLEKCLSYKEFVSLDGEQIENIKNRIKQIRSKLLTEI